MLNLNAGLALYVGESYPSRNFRNRERKITRIEDAIVTYALIDWYQDEVIVASMTEQEFRNCTAIMTVPTL